MPAHLVTEDCYQQLIDSLQIAVPKSLSIIGSLRNALKGRLKANFYVDKWPEFNAVVCQYIWPRRSDVSDIGAYATSSEALLSVLTEADLVSWGKRQEFQRIEDKHADYLLQHLRPPRGLSNIKLKCIHERTALWYKNIQIFTVNENVQDAIQKVSQLLPQGFVFGRLQPHHAEMVASQWPRLHGWPNKEPYFRELIKNYFCSALFSADDLDCPVSYVVTFPSSQHFGWTDQHYKGRRLMSFVTLTMIIDQFLMNNSFLPQETEISFPKRIKFEMEAGAVPSGYNVKDLAIDHVFCKL